MDQMVEIAQSVDAFENRVYRAYPAVYDNDGRPYAVLNPVGRNPVLIDERGSEIATTLMYSVDIYAESPIAIDEILRRLTDLYNRKGIQCTGYGPSYQSTNEMYCATANFSATVDVRGSTYR